MKKYVSGSEYTSLQFKPCSSDRDITALVTGIFGLGFDIAGFMEK